MHLSSLIVQTKHRVSERNMRALERIARARSRRDPKDMSTWSSEEFLAHCTKHGFDWKASPVLKAVRRRIANRESAKASRDAVLKERLDLEEALAKALSKARDYEDAALLLTRDNDMLRERLEQLGVHVPKPICPLPAPPSDHGSVTCPSDVMVKIEPPEEVLAEGTPSSACSGTDPGDLEVLNLFSASGY